MTKLPVRHSKFPPNRDRAHESEFSSPNHSPFFATEFYFCDAKIFSIRASLAIVILLEFRPAESGSFPRKSDGFFRDQGTLPQSQISSQLPLRSFRKSAQLSRGLPAKIPKSAPVTTALFQEFCHLQSVSPMAANLLHQNNKRKNYEKFRRQLRAPQYEGEIHTEGTYTRRDIHTKGHTLGGDIHMKGHTHGGTHTRRKIQTEGNTKDMHTEEIYIRRRQIHGRAYTWRDIPTPDTKGKYTRRIKIFNTQLILYLILY